MSTARLSASIRAGGGAADARQRLLIGALLPPATALVLIAAALLLLFLPLYMHPALDVAGSAQVLGVSREQAHQLSDRTVGELFLGPGTFAFAGPGGEPFYGPDEAAHMRDVRLVLFGFLAVAGTSLAIVIGAVLRGWRQPLVWSSIARGAGGLVIGLVVVGLFALLAFEIAFEVFHRLFFPGGNWAFDPAAQRLVQLYPLAFWQLTSAALALLAAALGLLSWALSRRRARELRRLADRSDL